MSAVPIDLIVALIRCDRYEAALPLLDEQIQQSGSNLCTIKIMSECLDKLGRREEAIAAYQLCVLLEEEPCETLVVLADLLRSVNNLEDANSSCETANAHAPDRAEAHASHSLVLSSMECFQEALKRRM